MASAEFERLYQMMKAMKPPAAPTLPPVEAMRKNMDRMTRGVPVDPDVRREPALAGGVPGEWFLAPKVADDAVLFYLHGGGYIMGSTETHRGLMARLGRAAGVRVLGINYRLAPEDPFPAALEDAVNAYRWLLDRGFPPSRIAIGGDSAGGGLTVATLIALREEKIPLPAGAILLSPWTDLEGLGESAEERIHVDPMIETGAMRMTGQLYYQDHDPRNPLISPIHADLAGLPPMLVQVGGAEVLFDDSVRLVDRARDCGVDARLDAWEEMIHVWHFFAGLIPEGQKAIDQLGAFLRERLG